MNKVIERKVQVKKKKQIRAIKGEITQLGENGIDNWQEKKEQCVI